MRKLAGIALLVLLLPGRMVMSQNQPSQDQGPAPEEKSAPKKQEPEAVPEPGIQDFPVQKLRYDYMSTFLSRSTNPLGLKEDPGTRELLKQPGTTWALRAGARNILN